jgi:lipoprotein LpqH
MQNRFAAATAVVFTVACLGGCSLHEQAPSPPMARVTINGRDAMSTNVLKCTQLQWSWMIGIGDETSGATVTIDASAETPTAKSVHIRNIGNFTGIYSDGDGGNATANFAGETFTVAGTANGLNTDDPNQPAQASFKIVAKCW